MFTQNKPMFGSSGFGSTGSTAFGQSAFRPATGVTFGQPAQSTASGMLFGGTTGAGTAFGQPGTSAAPQQGTGLFGSTGTTGTGLFGAPAAPSTGFTFGNTAAPSATGGLFGSSTTAAPGTGLFGASTQGTTGGLFGSAVTPAQGGTTVKFNPVTGQDTMVRNGSSVPTQTKHQCISAMPEYEAKCLEELRVEDYLANRKGPQPGSSGAFAFGGQTQQQPAGTGLFGNTATSTGGGGLFGTTQNKPLFGATTTASTGLFGNSTATTAGGLFGQQKMGQLFGASTQPATTSAFSFGSPATAPTFGATSTSGGLFGSTAQPSTGLFGTVSTQPGSTLFGGAKPAFGATTTTSGGFAFGGPTAQPAPTFGGTTAGSLFGAKPPGTTPAFGSTAANTGFAGFGAAATQPGGLFGSTAQQRPLFGATSTAPAFGSTAPGTSLFGSTAGAPGTGLFGSTTAATAGGLFGAKPAGGLFGGGMSTLTAPSVAVPPPTNLVAEQALLRQQILALTNAPYGEADVYKTAFLPASKREASLKPLSRDAQQEAIKRELLGPPLLSHVAALSPSIGKPLLRHSPRVLTSMVRSEEKSYYDQYLSTDKDSVLPDSILTRKSVKQLAFRSQPKGDNHNHSLPQPLWLRSESADEALGLVGGARHQSIDSRGRPLRLANDDEPPMVVRGAHDETTRKNLSFQDTTNANSSSGVLRTSNLYPHLSQNTAQDETEIALPDIEGSSIQAGPHPTGIKLTRPEYYTKPSMSELARMVDTEGKCVLLDGFTVGRYGYGSVYWPGEIDVTGLDLDALVHFRHKEVDVYPDESVKPPVGEGLNRIAEITLERVWPKDRALLSPIKSPERLRDINYRDQLELATSKMGCDFKDYRPETGSWVFVVPHFTKYGLESEANEEMPLIEEYSKIKDGQPLVAKVQRERVQRRSLESTGAGEFLNGSPVLSRSAFAKRPPPPSRPSLPVMVEEEEDSAAVLTGVSPPPDFMLLEDTIDTTAGADVSRQDEMDIAADSHISRLARLRDSFFDEERPIKRHAPRETSGRAFLQDVLHRSRGLLEGIVVDEEDEDGMEIKRESPDADGVDESQGASGWMEDSSVLTAVHRQPSFLQVDRVYPDAHPLVQVPLATSVLCFRHTSLADLGLFHGRRFRIGMHPQGFYVVGGSQFTSSFAPSAAKSEAQTLQPIGFLEKFSLQRDSAYGEESMSKLLNCIREHSHFDKSTGYMVNANEDLLAALRSAYVDDSTLPNAHRQILDLIAALWTNEDPVRTKMAVADWIKEVTRDDVVAMSRELLQQGNIADAILGLLWGGLSESAVELALEEAEEANRDADSHSLAMAIASSGLPGARVGFLKQLSHWKDLMIDVNFGTADILSWLLLSGVLEWTLSDGTLLCPLREADWMCAFGALLWFDARHFALDDDTADDLSLRGAIQHYESCLAASADVVPPPLAPARGGNNPPSPGMPPLAYQLLRLYAKQIPLAQLIDSAAYEADGMDLGFAWIVYSVIRSLQFPAMDREAALHVQFAEQLASAGFEHEALLPLCYVRDEKRRSGLIRDMLYRHPRIAERLAASETLDDCIPDAFVHGSLALATSSNHRQELLTTPRSSSDADSTTELLEHLVAAGAWNRAHRHLVDVVAPAAIVHDSLSSLSDLIGKLEEHARVIPDWTRGGAILSQYLSVMNTVRSLQKDEIPPGLAETLSDLVRHVPALPLETKSQRLARREMGRRLVLACRLFLSQPELVDLSDDLVNVDTGHLLSADVTGTLSGPLCRRLMDELMS